MLCISISYFWGLGEGGHKVFFNTRELYEFSVDNLVTWLLDASGTCRSHPGGHLIFYSCQGLNLRGRISLGSLPSIPLFDGLSVIKSNQWSDFLLDIFLVPWIASNMFQHTLKVLSHYLGNFDYVFPLTWTWSSYPRMMTHASLFHLSWIRCQVVNDLPYVCNKVSFFV